MNDIDAIVYACFIQIARYVRDEEWTHDIILVPDMRDKSLVSFRRENQFQSSYYKFAEDTRAPCIIWSSTHDRGIDLVIRIRNGGEQVYATYFDSLGGIDRFVRIAESTEHVLA